MDYMWRPSFGGYSELDEGFERYRAESAVWDKFVRFRLDDMPAESTLEYSGESVDH